MKPHTSTAQAGADMTHRECFEELTGERVEWTPVLDECLRPFFWLQVGPTREPNPMGAVLSYGKSQGIAQALRAAGLISESQRQHLESYAKFCMGQKVLPLDGCNFTIRAGIGRPPEGLGLPTLQ